MVVVGSGCRKGRVSLIAQLWCRRKNLAFSIPKIMKNKIKFPAAVTGRVLILVGAKQSLDVYNSNSLVIPLLKTMIFQPFIYSLYSTLIYLFYFSEILF